FADDGFHPAMALQRVLVESSVQSAISKCLLNQAIRRFGRRAEHRPRLLRQMMVERPASFSGDLAVRHSRSLLYEGAQVQRLAHPELRSAVVAEKREHAVQKPRLFST